jgi:hypothetical protein
MPDGPETELTELTAVCGLPDPFEHRHTDPCPDLDTDLDTGVESRRGEGWG